MVSPQRAWVKKNFFRSPIIKLLVTICSIAYVLLFLMWESDHLRSIEPALRLSHLDQKSINKASAVEVGMYINNFQEFSIQQNEFTLDGVIWFKFPAGSESLQTIEDFTIKNSMINNSGKTIYKDAPIIKIIGNDVLVSYHVLTTFKTNLVYKHFPIGNHTINIEIQNKSVTPYEFYFVSKPENLTIDKDFSYILYDWHPVFHTIETGYATASTDKNGPAMDIRYPVALFSIEFINVGYRNVLTLYFPMLVLFLIALFCLLLDITESGRLAYVATAIPLLVLFRMVIDSISPRTSYLTNLDYMYYLLILLCLFIILFQAFVMFVMHTAKLETGKMPESTEKELTKANDIAFFVILALLVILTTYSYFR